MSWKTSLGKSTKNCDTLSLKEYVNLITMQEQITNLHGTIDNGLFACNNGGVNLTLKIKAKLLVKLFIIVKLFIEGNVYL